MMTPNGSVTKSDDNFDPTPIANSEGIYPHRLPSKQVELVMEEGPAKYYGLLPKDQQKHIKKERKTVQAPYICSEYDSELGLNPNSQTQLMFTMKILSSNLRTPYLADPLWWSTPHSG